MPTVARSAAGSASRMAASSSRNRVTGSGYGVGTRIAFARSVPDSSSTEPLSPVPPQSIASVMVTGTVCRRSAARAPDTREVLVVQVFERPGSLGVMSLALQASLLDLADEARLGPLTGSVTRILTDAAVDAEKIDEKAAEEAIARAQKTLAELKPGEQQEEVAAVMATIQRATAQLHLKRKRRTL